MSAFVVSSETISDIVYALLEYDCFDSDEVWDLWQTTDPQKIGQNLFDLNQRAVNGRYRENAQAPTYKHNPRAVSSVQIFKSFDSFIYQCSEEPVYDEEVYKKLRRMRDALGCAAIRDTQDYREAVWG